MDICRSHGRTGLCIVRGHTLGEFRKASHPRLLAIGTELTRRKVKLVVPGVTAERRF
ncbi:hypothetical protein [uncultured Sphingomonas sp.]|uniref:hypothetical protein n=1 Tax=uncultured Sphingomonas sp. TaxID=158754 RepID=UPI0035C95759